MKIFGISGRVAQCQNAIWLDQSMIQQGVTISSQLYTMTQHRAPELVFDLKMMESEALLVNILNKILPLISNRNGVLNINLEHNYVKMTLSIVSCQPWLNEQKRSAADARAACQAKKAAEQVQSVEGSASTDHPSSDNNLSTHPTSSSPPKYESSTPDSEDLGAYTHIKSAYNHQKMSLNISTVEHP
jgi:hypothetical protein